MERHHASCAPGLAGRLLAPLLLLVLGACSDTASSNTASATASPTTPQVSQQPAVPQAEGWFSLQGDIEVQVEEAEVSAEYLAGDEEPRRLMIELQLRRDASSAPEAGVVLLGVEPGLLPGEYALRGPQAGAGLRAFVVARSDRVGSMRDFTDQVTGTLRVTEGAPGELVASFHLAAVETRSAPPVDDAAATEPTPRGGTAPDPPPGRVEAQGALRLPLAAARAPQPAPLIPVATAPPPVGPAAP